MIPREICFLAGTLGQGGAERQLFYILQALKQSGAAPRLLALSQGEFWEDRIRRLEVPVEWVGAVPSRVGRLASIIKALRPHRPQILQSQHFYANLYVTAAARLLGIHEVGAIRNNGVRAVWSTGPVLGRLSLHSPRVLAANSEASIRHAITQGVQPARLHLLPNVVDTGFFQPRQRPASRDPLFLLMVGRLKREKRVDRFLRVLAEVRRRSPRRVVGLIAGTGSLQDELRRLATDLNLLPDGVVFLGAQADLRATYARADILVLTSDYEGTPNVVLEAMASGLAVVATEVGGVPEIIRSGETGFLIEPQDERSLTETLLMLLGAHSLRREIGECARHYVEEHHSLIKLPQFLGQLYNRVLV